MLASLTLGLKDGGWYNGFQPRILLEDIVRMDPLQYKLISGGRSTASGYMPSLRKAEMLGCSRTRLVERCGCENSLIVGVYAE